MTMSVVVYESDGGGDRLAKLDPAQACRFFVALHRFREPLVEKYPADVVEYMTEAWIRECAARGWS